VAGTTGGTVSPSSNLQGGVGLGIATGTGPSSAAAANGAAASGSTNGSDGASGGFSSGGYYGSGTAQDRARAYSLRAIYFRRDLYKSSADCLTAAYTQQLPLDLCK